MKAAIKAVMKRVRDLHPDPDNPRKNLKEIRILAASIKAIGLQVPLRISRDKDGRFIVIDGNRRLAAFGMLGMEDEFIPCVISDGDENLTSVTETLSLQARDMLARLAQHGHTRMGWSSYEAACLFRDAIHAGVPINVLAETAGTWPLKINRGQKVLEDLERFHYGPNRFSIFLTAHRRGVDPRHVDVLIKSGHVTSTQNVSWLPVIMTKFKQPWKSKRTLLDLYQAALRGSAP